MFGLKLAGSYAIDSLRMEKGYRHWAHELDSETTPLEARLMHAVDLKKVIISKTLNYEKEADVGILRSIFTSKSTFNYQFKNILLYNISHAQIKHL